MGILGRALSSLLDVLAPPVCAACDSPHPGCGPFCLECGVPSGAALGGGLEGVPFAVAGAYAPPLSTAIVRFKYEGRAELSRPLASLLLPALARLELPEHTTLVPVPLHPRRLAKRGYNQSALLAQELARGRRLTCEPRLLSRTRETERQVGKSRKARLENAREAFELRKADAISVVLVDDVITTGSTVRACAQALARGGVRLVAILALARAEPG